MSRKQAHNLLNVASELVPCGIYAIEKAGRIKVVNLPMPSSEIKKTRKEYGRQGYKVYANG